MGGSGGEGFLMRWRMEHDVADFVVVGTGAGGGTAARVLSEAGQQVLMLEEGPWLRPQDRPDDALGALRASMRGLGTVPTIGSPPIPLLQGRLVGGSTAVNSAIVWRTPEDVLVRWRRDHGLGSLLAPQDLRRAFESLERELEVAPVDPAVLGDNARLMRRAAEALGLPGRIIDRNAARCRGSARCLQGCATGGRRSTDVAYVPYALRRGARLHAGWRVRRILVERGRAVGVEGERVVGHDARVIGRFRVRARRGVVLAAGAVHSPVILWRSGLRRMVGRGFQAHPGLPVVGRFPEPVRMGFGVTQGYQVPLRERGFKLESLSLPPEMMASRLPGVGGDWQRRLARLGHYGQWVAMIRMEARGRVLPNPFGEPLVRYQPTERDLARTREAVALLCRMMFAAGAEEVHTALWGVPETMTNPAQVEQVERMPLRRAFFHFVASHLFGGAVAGGDPGRSVVGPQLQCWDLSGLHVLDASVLPSNLGVNPQHTIMALAWVAAARLANAPRVRSAA